MSTAAVVRDVTMRFRDHTALDDISAVIEQDSITGLLGRNGAGKTTLMQLLTGHRVPTSGSVEVFGAAPYENDAVLCNIAFIKPGRLGDRLVATAREISRNGRSGIYDVRVSAGDQVIAEFRGHCRTIVGTWLPAEIDTQ